MEYSIKSGNPEKQRSACVVVGIHESRRLSPSAEQIDKASGGQLTTLLRRGDMDGTAGQSLMLYDVPGTLCDRVLLIGCGRERGYGDTEYRRVIAAMTNCLANTGVREVSCFLTELAVKGRDLHWKVRQAVEGIEAASYRFDDCKSAPDKELRPLRRVILSVPSRRDLPTGERAVLEGEAIANGVKISRDLGNLPGNICTPTYLAEQSLKLNDLSDKVSVTVLEQADMEALGMGALLSVSRGSRQPPKLITIEYNGGDKDAKPYVLVGKGLTFDAGGISIKPSAGMDEMKYDMCGGAGVIGTMHAVIQADLPLNIVGIVPSSENLPDGDANKPGDIVTSMSGQTIEILNTDAEGRLILCDALTYAERFNPAAVVDIATLTGACVVALGGHATGLLGNHGPLVNELLHAGRSSADRAWELPLWEDYQEQLESNFADMANVGGRQAGTITAACFLARYTKKYHWAHLDIAGTAWLSGKQKGSTGRPVPLLVQYLLDRADA